MNNKKKIGGKLAKAADVINIVDKAVDVGEKVLPFVDKAIPVVENALHAGIDVAAHAVNEVVNIPINAVGKILNLGNDGLKNEINRAVSQIGNIEIKTNLMMNQINSNTHRISNLEESLV